MKRLSSTSAHWKSPQSTDRRPALLLPPSIIVGLAVKADNTVILSPAMVVRDPEYYREGGDLVVLVEDTTLFRVHKGAFMRESSAFLDMFSAPQTGVEDGTSEEKPFSLSDDTVEEFRALCWSVYASPLETSTSFQRAFDSDYAESSRFLSLAMISHKYMFEETEKWARKSLDQCCSLDSQQKFGGNNFLPIATVPDLLRLIKYAKVTNHTVLSEATMDKFIERVDAHPRQLDVLDALKIADDNDWRGLQGEMYYRILCDAAREARTSAKELGGPVPFQSKLPTQLSDSRKSRLMQGYVALMSVYELVMVRLCLRMDQGDSYANTYAESLSGHARTVPVDVLGHLNLIITYFRQYSTSVPEWEDLYEQVKANLPAYFLDPLSGLDQTDANPQLSDH